MNAPAAPTKALHNQPPDPNPRAPGHPPPPLAWDCHIHLFGPASQWQFEAHSPYTSDDALPEQYLAMLDKLGLARAVIVSAGGYGRNYRHLQSVLERFGHYFRGVILPAAQMRREEVRAAATARRARHPFFWWSAGTRMEPPAGHRRAARGAGRMEAGMHVQFQSLVHGHLVEVADQLLALPNSIVLDHYGAFDAALGLGQPAFTTLLRMLDTGRVWVKLSAPMRSTREEFPYPSMQPFTEALVRHAPERMLWGSDWPHVQQNDRKMPNDGALLDLFAEWVPDRHTRDRIFRDNPRPLYE